MHTLYVPLVRAGMRHTCMNPNVEFEIIKIVFHEIMIILRMKFILNQRNARSLFQNYIMILNLANEGIKTHLTSLKNVFHNNCEVISTCNEKKIIKNF